MTSPPRVGWLTRRTGSLGLCAAILVIACSREKKAENYYDPTDWDKYVAAHKRARSKSQDSLDSARRVQAVAARTPTGDADHDFLRAISGHTKNVIALADAALESNRRPEMEKVIRHVEERHGHESDSMTDLLRNTYKDQFIPAPTDEAKSIAGLIRQSGGDNRGVFLDAVIKAEEEALRIEDLYLSKAKRSDVKRLAARIRADETSAIADLRKRVASR